MSASPHELLDALYAGINALDAPALRSSFVPGVCLVRVGPPLAVMTIDTWLNGLPTIFTEHEELELSRIVEPHGPLAHATSRFVIRHRVTKQPLRAGTNSLTLTFTDGVWRFAAAVWVADAA
jgi:hypothetical protein